MVSTATVDAIGYIGGYVVALASPAQLIKGLRTWSTKDISWIWVSQFLCGLILLFTYGLLADLPVIWIPICLEIFCAASILSLKTWIEVVEGKVYALEAACQTGDGEASDGEEKVLYSRPWKGSGNSGEEEGKEDSLVPLQKL